jgi:hypothetical protein
MNSIELRDYLAGKALQGLLISHPTMDLDSLVLTSYSIADKMIKHKNESENLENIINSKQIELNLK